MKSNTSTWLVVLIITIFGLTNIHPAIAGGTKLRNNNPDSSATKASWASTAPEMTAWLVKWDEKGNVVKQYTLSVEISGNDTTFFSRECGCKIEASRVRWYPKFNNANDERVYMAQKTANNALYASFKSDEYSPKEADALYRKTFKMNGQARWQFIDSLLTNSPRSKRLARLESDVTQLTADVAQIKAQLGDSTLVTKMEFQTELVDVWSSMETVGTFAKAADEQLSKSRGHSWTQIKRRYGLMIVHDAPKETTAAEAMPTPRRRL